MVTLAHLTIEIVQTGLLFLAVLLHSLGIYLLCHIKETRTDQNVILVHLSLVEIITSLFVIGYNAARLSAMEINDHVALLSYLFIEGIYLAFHLIMIVLTSDRLAMTLLSLKYQMTMTRRRMKLALAVCWITRHISGGLFVVLRLRWIVIIIHMLLIVCFMMLTVVTYTSILCKIRKRRKSLQKNANAHISRGNNRVQDSSKFYLVTTLIMSSFTLFVVIPYVYSLYDNVADIKSFKVVVLQLVWSANNIIDPCIYIFLQMPVRNLLRRKLITWCRTRHPQQEYRGNSARTIT